MSSHTTHPIHPHIKDLSVKLQHEVNGILETVKDSTLHAEFFDLDMMDIEHGIDHNVMRESLDARIQLNMKRKSERRPVAHHSVHSSHQVHHHTSHPPKKPIHKTVKHYLDILFKPFEM